MRAVFLIKTNFLNPLIMKRELLGSRQISFIEKSIESNDAWNLYAQQVL